LRELERIISFEISVQARDREQCSLAADVLRSSGVLKLRAAGVSMLPALWPGDLLIVHSQRPEHAERGEIVLYMRRGRFFIHRVVSKNPGDQEAFLVTRGDSMPKNDLPVRRSEFLGKVTEIRRAGAMLLPARKLSLFSRILAFMFCHWSLFRRAGLRLWASCHKDDRQIEPSLVKAAS
jgi:signal peptidase I